MSKIAIYITFSIIQKTDKSISKFLKLFKDKRQYFNHNFIIVFKNKLSKVDYHGTKHHG